MLGGELGVILLLVATFDVSSMQPVCKIAKLIRQKKKALLQRPVMICRYLRNAEKVKNRQVPSVHDSFQISKFKSASLIEESG